MCSSKAFSVMALIDVPSTAASGLIRYLVEQHFATEKPKGKKAA
jgi:hypothetical protein